MSFRRKNDDILSHLPEEVLLYILCFMPIKFAVRTSILSKRWRYNWTLITHLHFNDRDYLEYGAKGFLKMVDWVFDKHCKTSQVKLFRLDIFHSSANKSKVSEWIKEAVRLNVCEVDVEAQFIKLPLSLFTCQTLTKLSLHGCNCNLKHFIVPSVVILPRLKTLDIAPNIDFHKAFRLICGCPMLESLSLSWYNERQEDFNFNIPTLKRLNLTTNGRRCINNVILNVPNLEYLWVGGVLCSLFVIKDLSSLVEATVSFSHYCGRIKRLSAVELLEGISGVKSLSWSTPTFHVLLKSPLPKFPNLKHLELKNTLHSRLLQLFQHLESSSKLEHLCFEEPEESFWIEPQSNPTWMLTNLKTLEITRCKGRECSLQFIEYVLGNTEVLKTLTIRCDSLWESKEYEMRLWARLITFSRAVRSCKINFVGRWVKSTQN